MHIASHATRRLHVRTRFGRRGHGRPHSGARRVLRSIHDQPHPQPKVLAFRILGVGHQGRNRRIGDGGRLPAGGACRGPTVTARFRKRHDDTAADTRHIPHSHWSSPTISKGSRVPVPCVGIVPVYRAYDTLMGGSVRTGIAGVVAGHCRTMASRCFLRIGSIIPAPQQPCNRDHRHETGRDVAERQDQFRHRCSFGQPGTRLGTNPGWPRRAGRRASSCCVGRGRGTSCVRCTKGESQKRPQSSARLCRALHVCAVEISARSARPYGRQRRPSNSPRPLATSRFARLPMKSQASASPRRGPLPPSSVQSPNPNEAGAA